MKLCKDCKHYRKPWFSAAVCERAVEKRTSIDPVTGESVFYEKRSVWGESLVLCRVMRKDDPPMFDHDLCGPDADWFEPKSGGQVPPKRPPPPCSAEDSIVRIGHEIADRMIANMDAKKKRKAKR